MAAVRPARLKLVPLVDLAAGAGQLLALERLDKATTVALAVQERLRLPLVAAVALERLVETPLRLRVARAALGLPTL